MNTLRTAAQQALEALENPWAVGPEGVADAITALRAALAEPEQKPVAWLSTATLMCIEPLSKMNRRLSVENEALRRAYWKMRNSAAGYSNYCDDDASTRRCERDYTEGEALYRAAIKAAEENT